MRPICIVPLAFILAITVTGCGSSGDRATASGVAPTPGVHREGGSLQPFYGEVFHDNRFYLFGTKLLYNQFMAQTDKKEMNPLKSKVFIGKGPQRETVVAETSKDTPVMTNRLLNQFRKRYQLPPVG